MKKKLKFILFIFPLLLLFFTFSSDSNISRATFNNTPLKIPIGEVFFETSDYDSTKIYIEKEQTFLEEIAYIKELNSNKTLRIVKINKNYNRSYSTPFQLSQTLLTGPINVNITAHFQMYVNGSFREVEYVNSANLSIPWKKSATALLSNPYAAAWKESATTIGVSYNATVTGSSDGTLNREFDNAGYQYLGNGEYYKYISGSSRISLY